MPLAFSIRYARVPNLGITDEKLSWRLYSFWFAFSCRLHRHAHISLRASLDGHDLFRRRIRLARDVAIHKKVYVSGYVAFSGKVDIGQRSITHGDVVIGRYSYISGAYSEINSESNRISIRMFCSIARNCFIRTSNHFMDRLTTLPRVMVDFMPEEPFCELKGDAVISHDVWIGSNVAILDIVSIGNDAIVAAGSIVTKDVAPYSIVAGSQARCIRIRFDEVTISHVAQMKWWGRSDQLLRAKKSLFSRTLNAI